MYIIRLQIMETSGPELMKYKSEIESVLTAVLKLNGKKAYGFASHILSRLIQSLIYIYPLESKLSEQDYDDPNYLAINVSCELLSFITQ